MSYPAFRFVAADIATDEADAEFWRDIEASERLPSIAAADHFIRDLCRAKAAQAVALGRWRQPSQTAAERETVLLRTVRSRGYRVLRTEDEPAGS